MKPPCPTKIDGRRRRAGVAIRDATLARKLVVVPLAVVLALTLASGAVFSHALINPEPASAHEVMKRVGRPQKVCTTETRQVQVIVGYEGAGRFRQPVYGWKTETREFCEWKNVISYVPRPHLHVSNEVCEYVQVFVIASTTTAGAGVGTIGGMAVGSAITPGAGTATGGVVGGSIGAGAGAVAGHWVNKRVCNWIPSVIWFG